MDSSVSTLKLASAMARYAGHANQVTASNISRADIPGALGNELRSFQSSLKALERSKDPESVSSNTAINLEDEMLGLAASKGQHDAAMAIWKSSLKMMRLAVGAPQA